MYWPQKVRFFCLTFRVQFIQGLILCVFLILYSSKISSNYVSLALSYRCYWLRQFYLQPQNSILSWLRQFYPQPQNPVLSNLWLASYFDFHWVLKTFCPASSPLAFNCPNQYSYFKKGSEKGSDSVDFYWNVLKLTKRKNAWIAFFFCIDSYWMLTSLL